MSMTLLSPFLLLFGMTLLTTQESNNAMLINVTQPAVYLTFERVGKRAAVRLGESGDGVWLRIHNNTRVAISVCTQSLYIGSKVSPLKLATGKDVLGLRDAAEVSVCYDVDEQKTSERVPAGEKVMTIEQPSPYQRLNIGSFGHVSSISWIPSGHSAVIDLPKEHLAQGYRISIPFNFEWEANSRNVAHSVYFYASDMKQ